MKGEISQKAAVVLIIVIVAAIVGVAGYVLVSAPAPTTTTTTTTPTTTTTTTTPTTTTTTTTAPPTTTTTTAPPTTTTTTAPGATIKVITYAGPESDILEKGLYTAFEEETGINVEVEVYDEPTLREKMILDFEAGTGTYDVVRVQFWHIPEYISMGWLEPLNEYIETKPNPEWLDLDQIPGLDALTHDGNIYALTDTLLSNVMIYRKDIFDAEGWKVPTTVAEYLDILDKFENCKLAGKYTDMYGTWGRGYSSFDAYGSISGWTWAYGSTFIDFVNGKPVARVNDAVNVQAMEDWVHMLKEHGPPGQATIGWVKGGELFCGGKILMQTEVSGFGNYYNNPELSGVAGKVGFALSPIGPAGEHVQWYFSTGLGINADSKNKDAAWKFIQWRTSAEGYKTELANNIRLDMPYLAAYGWPEHTALAENWGVEEFMKVLPEAQAYATGLHWPLIPEFTEVSEAITTQISAAIAGTKTVQAALDDAQVAVNAILTEAGY